MITATTSASFLLTMLTIPTTTPIPTSILFQSWVIRIGKGIRFRLSLVLLIATCVFSCCFPIAISATTAIVVVIIVVTVIFMTIPPCCRRRVISF